MGRLGRAAVAAGIGLAAVLSADATAQTNEKAPDWSGYTTVSDVVGQVVKSTDTALTIRVKWYVTTGGGNNHRIPLSGNHRNFHNPFMHRGSGSRPQTKEMHHDYELEYVPQSLVRFKSLPPKTDDNGKPHVYGEKERDVLRQPAGVPGWVATKKDIVLNSYVEVILVRDRTISATKATEDDLRLKYVYLLGHPTATSPGSSGSAGAADTAKKK